jgi:hypothetical protein
MVQQILKMYCALVQTRMPIASHSVQREFYQNKNNNYLSFSVTLNRNKERLNRYG